MRQVYAFVYDGDVIAQVIAETEAEAREQASREADIFCDRPLENPWDRRLYLKHAAVRTYPAH